jgi:hypothetical protein
LVAAAAAWGVVVMTSSFDDGAQRHMRQLPQFKAATASGQRRN